MKLSKIITGVKRTLAHRSRHRIVLIYRGVVIFFCGIFIILSSLPAHENSLKDPVAAKPDPSLHVSLNHEQAASATALTAVNTTAGHDSSLVTPKQVTEEKYKLASTISYFQHADAGLVDDTYCIHNSSMEECCTKEHCAAIVNRSTLYSECCDNVHLRNFNQKGPVKSTIFPLLITSSPRSGTWFMQQLLTKTGLHGLTTGDHSPSLTGTVSWKHAFQREHYFTKTRSSTHLYQSKFRVIWHLVRDPLQTLTSIAFTEPLWEDSDHSQIYIDFISSHVPITHKTALMYKFNITEHEMEDVMSHRAISNSRDAKLEHFLIYRALEIYLNWNGFINYLNVPLFRLEDLAVKKNLTVLDEIFRSVGQEAPSHDKVLDILNAQQAERHFDYRHRRRLEPLYHAELQVRGKRIRKGSRVHRSTLSWNEICRVSRKKVKVLLEMSQSFGYYKNVTVESLCP